MVKPFKLLSDKPHEFLPFLEGEEIVNVFLCTFGGCDGDAGVISLHFGSGKVFRVSCKNGGALDARLELRDKKHDRK